MGYAEEELIGWLAALGSDADSEVPQRYDREHKQFISVEREKSGVGSGTLGLHQSGAYGGRVLDNAEGKNQTGDLIYQHRDPDQISDRELLANVMDSAASNEAELDFVRRYRKQIEQLDQKQRELEDTRQKIADAKKSGARKSDIAVLQNKAKILAGQIDRMDGKLLEFEAGKPLQAVVKRQREALREKANERLREYSAKAKRREAAAKAPPDAISPFPEASIAFGSHKKVRRFQASEPFCFPTDQPDMRAAVSVARYSPSPGCHSRYI